MATASAPTECAATAMPLQPRTRPEQHLPLHQGNGVPLTQHKRLLERALAPLTNKEAEEDDSSLVHTTNGRSKGSSTSELRSALSLLLNSGLRGLLSSQSSLGWDGSTLMLNSGARDGSS